MSLTPFLSQITSETAVISLGFSPGYSPRWNSGTLSAVSVDLRGDLPGSILVEPSESRHLVVTLRQLGSLRPNLTGSKSHTVLLSFGFQVQGKESNLPVRNHPERNPP
jgi:hypothetical protein